MADIHGSPAAGAQIPAAPSAGPAPAPYYPGALSPICTGGDDDAGGRDDVSGTVAGSVAAAEARWHEHEADTFGQGSVIGDLMTLPTMPEDASPPSSSFLFAEGDQPGKGT